MGIETKVVIAYNYLFFTNKWCVIVVITFYKNQPLFNEVDRRTATITATTECEIAILNDNDIINLCNEDHSLGYKIMKNLAEKLASSLERTNSQVLKLTTVFSLILDN